MHRAINYVGITTDVIHNIYNIVFKARMYTHNIYTHPLWYVCRVPTYIILYYNTYVSILYNIHIIIFSRRFFSTETSEVDINRIFYV